MHFVSTFVEYLAYSSSVCRIWISYWVHAASFSFIWRLKNQIFDERSEYLIFYPPNTMYIWRVRMSNTANIRWSTTGEYVFEFKKLIGAMYCTYFRSSFIQEPASSVFAGSLSNNYLSNNWTNGILVLSERNLYHNSTANCTHHLNFNNFAFDYWSIKFEFLNRSW